MFAILMEGILFVAAIAAVGALLSYFVLDHTSLGTRIKQAGNRRRIENVAQLRCPIHGDHIPQQMVRLPSGVVVCPECFQETVYDQRD